MQARAPLMIEHRLIEQMLLAIKDALAKIKLKHKVDPVFVDRNVSMKMGHRLREFSVANSRFPLPIWVD